MHCNLFSISLSHWRERHNLNEQMRDINNTKEMKNSADLGECYPPRPLASVDHPPWSAEFFISYESEFKNCFIIHSKYFPVPLKEFHHFPFTKLSTTLYPGFVGQRFNDLQRAALLTTFWRHRFNNLQRAALLTSFWRHRLNNLQRAALLTSFWRNRLNNLQWLHFWCHWFTIWSTTASYSDLCVWF